MKGYRVMGNKLEARRLNAHRIVVDGYEMACYINDKPEEVSDDIRHKLGTLEDINTRRLVDADKIAAYRFAVDYVLTDEGRKLLF